MVRIDGSFFCRLELHRSSVDLEEGVMGRTRYVPNLLEMFRGTLFFVVMLLRQRAPRNKGNQRMYWLSYLPRRRRQVEFGGGGRTRNIYTRQEREMVSLRERGGFLIEGSE